MNNSCDCFAGLAAVTVLPVTNPPGLSKIRYRIGTQATFLETMKVRLSSKDYPALADLKTRESSDPAIALLDSWAAVADVLTFYQERIAIEGYLRTATERRSILELARLVGYKPRPGVATSVYLGFTLENGYDVTIPKGTRSQSLPGPGELPQPFETMEDLESRSVWNNLQPRMTRPQLITEYNADTIEVIYLQGTSTNLKPNDLMLLVSPNARIPRRVRVVEPQEPENRTRVVLQIDSPEKAAQQLAKRYLENWRDFCLAPDDPMVVGIFDILDDLGGSQGRVDESLLQRLQDSYQEAAKAGRSSLEAWISGLVAQLSRIADAIKIRSASAAQAVAASGASTSPRASTSGISKVEIYALRVTAPLFGHNAPQKVVEIDKGTGKVRTSEWPVVEDLTPSGKPIRIKHEAPNVVNLDASYSKILSDSWVIIDTTAVDAGKTDLVSPQILVAKARDPNAAISRAKYGISGNTTRIELASPSSPSEDVKWIGADFEKVQPRPDDFQIIRRTVVYAQSELLALAEEPIEEDICGKEVELGALYDGLHPGRWIIVSGERTDIIGNDAVQASELAMLSSVQRSPSPDLSEGEAHSHLLFTKDLDHTYRRNAVVIYGNAVLATHGEARTEVLGSGDGSRSLQRFKLSQEPLTYIPAVGSDGIASTLDVYVDDLLWHEADSIAGLGPKDRRFITQTDDDNGTTVVFGNGVQGARLPTGQENISAVYRIGIGKAGNVNEGQISLLATRPLGVKSVINPLPATGGTDREGRDQARLTAPLGTMALDRLVSVQDYADFARAFAGIGKASARRLSNGRKHILHLTIAGVGDIPIDENSDLFGNLHQALHQFGDPHQPVQVARRELLLLVISARVKVDPDHKWESVEPKVRAALLDAFSFDRRELGQSVFSSEVISTIQQVDGVSFVDLEIFDSVSESTGAADLTKLAPTLQLKSYIDLKLARPRSGPAIGRSIDPAQLAYLPLGMPEALMLKEMI